MKEENLNHLNKVIQIGTQMWTTENLSVSKYRNGDDIPQVQDAFDWEDLTTGAWCYFNNDPKEGVIYGKLYNWYAVNDTRGLAPEGYHIPSNEEWTTLINYLGGRESAGGKMKMEGTTHWHGPNKDATNESGFRGLPGGFRADDDDIYHFLNRDLNGCWWSSSEKDWSSLEEDMSYIDYLKSLASYISLQSSNGIADKEFITKTNGYYVRCLKD